MNAWIEKSIELARQKNYLDRLWTIYKFDYKLRRPIEQQIKEQIFEEFDKRDKKRLLRLLLNQQKFPFLDPFVGSLREFSAAIDKNPRTADRLWEILYNMGKEAIINGIEEPAQANRLLGPLFKNWLRSLQIPMVGKQEFVNTKGLAFLRGSEAYLQNFANGDLQCELEKKPDFLAKASFKYIIGEAKFLTTPGGNQDKSFREVISFVNDPKGNALRIGIMDGVLWFKDTGLYGTTLRKIEKPVMSALLLEEFLENLQP